MTNAGGGRTGPGISGGSVTVFVSNMDRAVRFYREMLGLRLLHRAGDEFAMFDVSGFRIGLHPPGAHAAAPGTRGCIQIGLGVSGPIRQTVSALESRGVRFVDAEGKGDVVVGDGAVKLASFHDPDGTELYLCETAWK